jgi:hypothetical protein
MKTRPILFSAPMVRALLDGSKMQTRRVVKPQPRERGDITSNNGELAWQTGPGHFIVSTMPTAPKSFIEQCPYGQTGDRLWVRETWQAWHKSSHEYDEWEPISVVQASASKRPDFYCGPTCDAIEYRATSKSVGPWTPSIHMPRWASRITLEITGVRVERLQDISEEDAWAEGCQRGEPTDNGGFFQAEERDPSGTGYRGWDNARDWYADLWEAINGAGSWEANPWVWCISLKMVE